MLASKTSNLTLNANEDIVRVLDSVRLAKVSVTSLRRQLQADRPRHRSLLSRSRELLAQSEDMLAKASVRRIGQSAPYSRYDHLAQAERHVKEGRDIIARQREIIATLQRGGHDPKEAVDLLTNFEDIQQLHLADRDRLRRELGIA